MNHHGSGPPSGIEAQLHEYMGEHLHPETARNIGQIVFRSPVGSAEFAFNIIVQMQEDSRRKDQDIDAPHFEYTLPDREGEALPPAEMTMAEKFAMLRDQQR